MKRIIQLNPLLANQIAAGEVIERPASVIKELVENSLDAKASQIEIELEGAGMQRICVRDDGVGILKDDLILAFSRHATSKIATVADLAAITSLGFRGEALASMACVAQCRLISRPKAQDLAWQVQIAPDLSAALYPAAHPFGTAVEVKELFYNTPARRKFLRSEKTEMQAIEEMLRRLALSHPQVSFRLKHQQRQIRYYPIALTDPQARVAQVCGLAFMEQALPLSMQAVGLALKGWVGLPTLSRRQADCQYFFINGRMVKDRLLTHAIKAIYQNHQLIEGTYPCYVLYLTVDPQEVDVNVHPTKQEVRFAQARLVHDFIFKAIEQALAPLEGPATAPSEAPIATSSETSTTAPLKAPPTAPLKAPPIAHPQSPGSLIVSPKVDPPIPQKPFEHKKSHTPNPTLPTKPSVARRYFFIEQAQGVTIVDLKKAYQVIWAFYFQHQRLNVATKALLFPFSITLATPKEILTDLLAHWAEFGFQARSTSQILTFLSIPAVLANIAWEPVLRKIATVLPTNNFLTALSEALSFEHLQAQPDAFLQEFIPLWLKATPTAQVVNLNHEQLVALIEQTDFSMSL